MRVLTVAALGALIAAPVLAHDGHGGLAERYQNKPTAGALPTKGLTLPLMSYGGSAILMNLVSLAVVLRIDYENRLLMRGGRA